jgi:hypothetical protein
MEPSALWRVAILQIVDLVLQVMDDDVLAPF